MGISGDIRPKKVYHYDPNRSHETAVQKADRPKEDENENFDVPINTEPELSLDDRDKLKDEFFSDQYAKLEKREAEYQPEHYSHKKKSHFPTKLIIILFIILFLIIFAYKTYYPKLHSYLYSDTSQNQSSDEESIYNSNSSSDNSTGSTSGSTTTPTPTTTPTTTAVIDKTTISLEVLNGNGVSGSANAVTKELTTAGFTVAKTSNAAHYTYKKTYVYFKTGQDAEAALVAAALTDRETETLVSDTIAKSYDVVVIVGTN